MKRLITIILFLVLAALIYQFYQLYSYHGELQKTFSDLSVRVASLGMESLNLQADFNYFQEPENLEKELRAKFNYKNPGEKLIIVVPSKTE
ncbi:MAG: hypothetical protein HYY86_00070 [Candidatus Harrisonbacteria bacterium]|nr:hypothetical protein [Candidatus Harrisonbacteria bacterium]